MHKTIFALALALLLSGCGGGGKTPLQVNAPGFKGIGDLTLGLTKEEAVSLLSGIGGYSVLASSFGEVEGVSGCRGDYSLKGETLTLYLTFFRDSLVFVEVGKGSSNLLREILTAKYGQGYREGGDQSFTETWVGETTTAEYTYYSDGNPDPYMRKTREVVEIFQTGRRVRKEIRDFAIQEKAEADRKREETLRDIW